MKKPRIFVRKIKAENVKIADKYTDLGKRHVVFCQGGYRSIILAQSEIPEYHYFEVSICTVEGNARIGFATEKAEKYGPIGVDSNGYSIGNLNGYLFHEGKRTFFGGRFKKDDIISCLHFTENGLKRFLFFINGARMGKEISNIKDGVYWPALSLSKGCKVDLNFINNFSYAEKIFRECNITAEEKNVIYKLIDAN